MRWPDRPVEIGQLAVTAGSYQPVRASLVHSGSEARRARGLVAGACEGLPEDLVNTARLLTSELVTNAVMYGDGELEMRVRRFPDQVLVEVLDQSREEPQLLPLDPDRPGGNGLRLVQALAHEWGIAHFPRSKSVWFVVR
jgi:anti-sigma regulatory factor (Ser/Thr protein kinase)